MPPTARPIAAAAAPTAAPEPDLARALELVMRMMAIPGRSTEEGRIIAFIQDELRRAKLPASAMTVDNVHRKSEMGGEIGNLIVKLPGTLRGSRRVLVGHVDTVPVCLGSNPKRNGDSVQSADPATGLGADNRSGAAAVLTALLEILRQNLPHPPVTFFFPVQEEIGLIGARLVSLNALGRPKMGFNFDANVPEKIYIGATGAYRLAIDITGIPSHAGSNPQGGASAITVAGLAIAELEQDGYLGAIEKGNRRATSNLGTIEGGSAVNVVAPSARIQAGVRSHDPKFRKQVRDRFIRAFESAAAKVRTDQGVPASVRVQHRLSYESFRLAEDEPTVAAAVDAIRGLGHTPCFDLSNGGLDANQLTARGVPTVTLGAGQSKAHTTDETLTVSHYHEGCRLALRLATGV